MHFNKSSLFVFKKNLKILLFVFFIFNLCSCQNENKISNLYENWILVEDLCSVSDSSIVITDSSEYKTFIESYDDFKSSSLYKNICNTEAFTEPINNLESAISSKDLVQIRKSISKLEATDNFYTFKSNKEYLFLSQLLMIICLFISVILILLFKQYEKKNNQNKQLGIYSKHMIKGIEWERNRISKDIHDTVLQDLKAISLKCELINSEKMQNNETIQKELINETTSCINALRSICNNLTPAEFKNYKNDNGFFLALHNLKSQFAEKTKITCILKIQENLDLSELTLDQGINIYRIIQESLNNVEKHSKANTVSIVVAKNSSTNKKNNLIIFITDDGIGFDTKHVASEHIAGQSHFGLSNIKERAKYLGANLVILSEKNEGTEIKLEVPLK